MFFFSIHIDGADYSFSRSRVTFNDFDREETVSSEFEIDILDDFISESTESFICFLLTPFGTTGIIAGEPNTLTVDIFDDDGKHHKHAGMCSDDVRRCTCVCKNIRNT